VRLQPGERRTQLVRRVGEEALLVAVRFLDLHQQLVQRLDQRRVSAGACAGSIGRRSRGESLRISPESRSSGARSARHAEPHQRERQHREQRLGHDAAEQDLAHQAVALARRLGDGDVQIWPPQGARSAAARTLVSR